MQRASVCLQEAMLQEAMLQEALRNESLRDPVDCTAAARVAFTPSCMMRMFGGSMFLPNPLRPLL